MLRHVHIQNKYILISMPNYTHKEINIYSETVNQHQLTTEMAAMERELPL